MVSAFLIIAAGLGAAFLLGFLRESAKGTAFILTLAGLAAMAAIAVSNTIGLATGTVQPVDLFTAGIRPPFAINLRLGLNEAALVSVIALAGLLSG